MTQIFSSIAITTMLVLGWVIITQEGMGLYFIREWGEEKKKNNKWIEPLILCHWCMPSSWSIVGMAFAELLGLLQDSWRIIIIYPIVVCGSSFCCGMLWLLFNMLTSRNNYYKNVEKLTHWDILDRNFKHKQRQEKANNNHPKTVTHHG